MIRSLFRISRNAYLLRSRAFLLFIIVWLFTVSYIAINGVGELETTERNLDAFDQCVLSIPDPYDEEYLRRYFDPNYQHIQSNCSRPTPLTELLDGKIQRTELGVRTKSKCWARCLFYLRERTNFKGKWFSIKDPKEFPCDHVETYCNNGTYADLHSRVLENNFTNFSIPDVKKYNVFVILIDSLSYTHGLRTMPKTMKYLREQMTAIPFPYVSRTGEHSFYNAMSLYFGYNPEPVEHSAFGKEDINAEASWLDICLSSLDNRTHIFNEFQKGGYKTLVADDYVPTVLGYRRCQGFTQQRTDHIWQPNRIALVNDEFKVYAKTKTKASCFQLHDDILKYYSEFMHSYKDHPKFAFVWLSDQSHDHPSGLVPFDKIFVNFLKENQDAFDDSFLFLLGDHGPRITNAHDTNLAVYEVKNPSLTISLPRVLRKDKMLIQKMLDNAKDLQTHIDTRATWIDIALHQPKSSYKDRSYIKIGDGKGSSLLREQPKPRNCKTLPVPFPYCLCRFRTQLLNDSVDHLTMKKLGQAIIDHINGIMAKNDPEKKCSIWETGEVVKAEKYVDGPIPMYLTEVKAKYPYPLAWFKALVMIKNGNYSVSAVERLDVYGNRGICVPLYYSLCDCKSNLEAQTTQKL